MTIPSIKADFKIYLLSTSFIALAQFDSVLSCNYTREINGIGSYSLTLNADDSRCDLFGLDYVVLIYRQLAGLGVDWYLDFVGLHRTPAYALSQDGKYIFTSTGVGANDLLARAIINYPEATIKSFKGNVAAIPAETAMKEYVEENRGVTATTLQGRKSEGFITNFSVEADTAAIPLWEGDRAYQGLLTVLQEISKSSEIEFEVLYVTITPGWLFRTYPLKKGKDRTITAIDPVTGLNSSGNRPTIFSRELGNVSSITYSYDRISESNVVTVLGDGDASTRTVLVRSDVTKMFDSPWNRRESSRPQNGYISDMENAGDAALKELSAKEIITIVPLKQKSCVYYVDFDLGDLITVRFRGVDYSRRIIKITNTFEDAVTFELAENPR